MSDSCHTGSPGGIHYRLGHGSGHILIQHAGDDIFLVQVAFRNIIRQSHGGGNLHFFVDGGGTAVQSTSENAGECQYIVDLVGKIRPTRAHDPGTGCLGSIGGCKVYVSPNIATKVEGGVTYHKCLVRTKRAIAFAEQLSEIEAYRPELRFADAVKGLYLFGAKVVYPYEIAVLNLNLPISPYENNYDE